MMHFRLLLTCIIQAPACSVQLLAACQLVGRQQETQDDVDNHTVAPGPAYLEASTLSGHRRSILFCLVMSVVVM